MKSTVYVIGSGAIGKALAVSLKLDNTPVTILRGTVDDGSSRVERIRILLENRDNLEAEIPVSTLSNFQQLDGLVVLANKSYGNVDLSRALKAKVKQAPVVILQNGLGVEQPFLENGFPEIYRCVLFVTSQTLSGTEVRFKPVSSSPIGTIKGHQEHLIAVVERLTTAHFPFRAEAHIQPVIWKKAIINCVFNSVCPLLDVDNGIFHREVNVLAIAKRVIEECVAIARASGILLTAEEVVDSLLMISKMSDGQLISTLQDIRQKRTTEIETLNFAIVDMARKLNLAHTVADTRLLGELTKLKSELNH